MSDFESQLPPGSYAFDLAGLDADAEQHALETMIPMPDGYTHIGSLVTANGVWTLAIGGPNVPAMYWWQSPDAEPEWRRLFPQRAQG